MVERFKKIDFISEYMEEITKEIENYNKENIINTELHINGKQLTNLRVFRAYLTNYLKNTIEPVSYTHLVFRSVICIRRKITKIFGT